MRYVTILSIAIALAACKKESVTPAPQPETSLTIEVRRMVDSGGYYAVDSGPLAEGASVYLYLNGGDMYAHRNQVAPTQITGPDGKVTFHNLDAIPYFFYVEKGCQNNFVATDGFTYQTSSGRSLTGGTQNVVGTVIKDWANVTILNASAQNCEVQLQYQFYFSDLYGPAFDITLKPGESKTFRDLLGGSYFVHVIKPDGTKSQSFVNLSECGIESTYRVQ